MRYPCCDINGNAFRCIGESRYCISRRLPYDLAHDRSYSDGRLAEVNAMNCPQCQAANSTGLAFCSNCGARMTVAPAAASAGYLPPEGAGAPLGYGASTAPAGYDAPHGYGSPGY